MYLEAKRGIWPYLFGGFVFFCPAFFSLVANTDPLANRGLAYLTAVGAALVLIATAGGLVLRGSMSRGLASILIATGWALLIGEGWRMTGGWDHFMGPAYLVMTIGVMFDQSMPHAPSARLQR